MTYVTNRDSNTVSVINGSTNTKVHDIPVGYRPWEIAVHANPNANTNMIYVTNFISNTLSVIDDSSDKIAAGIIFNVNPANSGKVICNNAAYLQTLTYMSMLEQIARLNPTKVLNLILGLNTR